MQDLCIICVSVLCNLNRVVLCSSSEWTIQALPKLSYRCVLLHDPTSSSRLGTPQEHVLAPFLLLYLSLLPMDASVPRE